MKTKDKKRDELYEVRYPHNLMMALAVLVAFLAGGLKAVFGGFVIAFALLVLAFIIS